MSKQAQGHDALGGQKMRANLGQWIPAISELSKCDSAPDNKQNMRRLYMDLRLYKADGRC